MKRRLLLATLSLLGYATACENGEDGNGKEIPTMYGTPRINYRIQGKTTDLAGKPIPGIEVSHPYDAKKVLSAADGSYDISGDAFPYQTEIVFTDIDGPDNGGEFKDKTLQVIFTEQDRTGPAGESWYDGSFARSGEDVTLEKKE